MEVLLYFLTGAGIGGLLTYLSTRIGRKGCNNDFSKKKWP